MTLVFGIPFFISILVGSAFIGSLFYNGKSDPFRLTSVLIKCVIGLGVFAYLSLGIGLFTTRAPFYTIFAIFAISCRIAKNFKSRRFPPVRLNNLFERPGNFLDMLLLIAVLLVILSHYLIAATPLIRWDAATHHYLVPKIWVQSGHIGNIPQIIFSEFPSTVETLFLMGIQSGDEWAANVIGWVLSILLILAIYEFTKVRFNNRTALVASLIFSTMPLMLELFTGGLIDVGYTLFCFMSFWMMIEYREGKGNGRLILSALFAGWALGSKHLGIEFIVALFLGIFIHDILTRQMKTKTWLKDFGIFIGIAFLLALPWYIKSYVHTGNPIFPFLPGLFNGLREVNAPISVRAWSHPDFKRGILSLVTYPWKLTSDFDFIDFWVMAISPIFLATIPFWWFYRKKYPVGFMGITIPVIVVFTIIAYIIAPFATRYMLPLLAIASVIAAGSIVFLADDLKYIGKAILILVLIIPFVFNISAQAIRVRDILPWFSGLMSRDELYMSHFEGYDSLVYINRNLPADALVLTTDPKGYFFRKNFIVGTPGAQSQMLPPWSEPDSMKVLEKWHELGITHLLFNLSKNVMKNSYFVLTVTKGIEEHGELIMTARELAELTKYETEYTYKPEEIAEFGRITQTPTIIKNGETYYHLYPEWWFKTVKQDKTQFMLRHYLNLKPYLKEIARFRNAIIFELQYPESFTKQDSP